MEHKCQFEGCTITKTSLYDYPVWDDEPPAAEWLCWEHASKNGFCPSCGHLVAGSGEENWRGGSVCYECYQELAYETGENDYDEDLDFWDDY